MKTLGADFGVEIETAKHRRVGNMEGLPSPAEYGGGASYASPAGLRADSMVSK